MTRNATNNLLHHAKKSKNDEFYTQLCDIEKEFINYSDYFRGKTIYCNCDDPRKSNFFNYFFNNFEKLGIKKLITSCYKKQDFDIFNFRKNEQGFFFVYSGEKEEKNKLIKDKSVLFHGDGDFRSLESTKLLKQCDVVVTNPPFFVI